MAEPRPFLCAPGLKIEAHERLSAVQLGQIDAQLKRIEALMERLEKRLWLTVYGVVGVILAYLDAPLEFRRFGINPFPPATGQRVHAALLELVASGAIRPTIGRRVAFGEVADALEDHAARRTSGRTVLDLSRA